MRALFKSAVQMMRRGEEGLLAVQDEWAGGHDVGGGQRCRGGRGAAVESILESIRSIRNI